MAFGDFDTICHQAALAVCSLVGSDSPITGGHGIQPYCFARSIEVANTIIFQTATDFIHLTALGMTVVMILHVRSKFTAVGRKEITAFFYIYMLLTLLSLLLDAGVILPGTSAYPWFTAAQLGLTSALCTCLLVNGFVGFQLYEDGTNLSIWMLRIASFVMFAISALVSLCTFKAWAGLSPDKTLGLFVVSYVINGVFLAVYVILQIILVTQTLEDRWPLGDIAFGVFFFVIGQVILYALNRTLCTSFSHYLDGLFFATICNLLAVMMVYKYWDSITREDLEFSVGTKLNNWEVKDPLLPDDERRQTIYNGGASGNSGASDGASDYSPGRTYSGRRVSGYGPGI